MIRRNGSLIVVCFVCLQLLFAAPRDDAGLRYEHRTIAGPLSIHILQVDPRVLKIEAVRALDDGVGRETVSSIAQRKRALAAVNAGFFRIGGRYDGEPDGILKIRQQWFSDPAELRGAIAWTRGGETARIGRLKMKWKLQSGGSTFLIDGINRPRGASEAILYNWAFHRSTLTDPDGTEFPVSGNRIVDIWKNGNAAIPKDGYVYSVGPQASISEKDLRAKAKIKVAYELYATAENGSAATWDWQAMDFIVGGMPALFFGRRLVFESNQEKMPAGFATDKHPRTAVGLRADGTWVFVVVDGRQPTLSVGMNLNDLSDLLLSLDCVDALNLDGGGSSTLYYQGSIANSPSDTTKERPVSDAIVILRR
jgi:exopolysaccharide biosynthesis protein